MLLSAPPRAASTAGLMSENDFMAGIIPLHTFTVEKNTTKKDIHAFCFPDKKTAVPVLGYLSYAYGLHKHGIFLKKENDFPLGFFRQYQFIVMGNTKNGTLTLMADKTADQKLADILCTALKNIQDKTYNRAYSPVLPKEAAQASLSKKQYMDRVRTALDHIRAGDTYQLNLSVRFDMPFARPPDTTSLFFYLWQTRPAPFYALIHHKHYSIISTSPERFLQVRDRAVLTQPIKGTLAFNRLSQKLITRLTTSPKERAELSMIVDLLRNDISIHCEYGSVEVHDHYSTFVVDNLIQMYSNVRGTLSSTSTVLDLLLDAFPGGSITGCPKLRTMHIIEELEPHQRDLYCGSVFFIKGPQTMDSSITIRTGWYDAKKKLFSWFAGSGLVADSDPLSEYEETLAKAKKFKKALIP